MRKAALAIEADGVMAEVHPDPAVALSDSAQQMDIPEFEEFWNAILASNLVPHKIKYQKNLGIPRFFVLLLTIHILSAFNFV
ncbi:hypothetical protein GCM10027614_84080 [Micromonospora vulcania]